MGFFSSIKKGVKKIGKGIKSAFKSIGRGIKSAVGKIGKFMDKIGIVGQLALMFTPLGPMVNSMFASIGSAVGGVFSAAVGQTATQATAQAVAQQAAVTAGAQAGASAAAVEAGKAASAQLAKGVANKTLTKTVTDGVVKYSAKATGLMSGGTIAQGAGSLLQSAGNFAKAGHSAFRTITDGLTSFIGEFSKTALKKIPGMETVFPKFLGSDVSDNFFGEGGAWSKVEGVVSKNAKDTLKSFNEAIGTTPTTPTNKPPTIANANPVKEAQGQIDTGTGPVKEGYKVPTEAATPEFGPLKDGYAGASVTDQSLLSNPQMSPVGVEASGAINPITNKPYNLNNKMTTPLTEQVIDSPKGFFAKTYGNAKTSITQGIQDFRNDPVGTLLGEEPLGKAVDRFSEQLTGNLANRAVMGVPEGAEVFNAHVPNIQTARAGQYASAEINDRAMQIQLTGSQFYMQNPYGFGANDYLNKMAISTGGIG